MVRVHFGPPLQKKNLYGGLAQLWERLPCKQEVTGSIPVLSTKRDWLKRERAKAVSGFIESLEEIQNAPWKLNIVIMMQLWEGNIKGNLFIKNLGNTTISAKISIQYEPA